MSIMPLKAIGQWFVDIDGLRSLRRRAVHRVLKAINEQHRFSLPFHLSYWRWLRLGILVLLDVLLVTISWWGAFALRMDTIAPEQYLPLIYQSLPIVTVIHLAVFGAWGMYRQVWRYANFQSATLVVKCTTVSTLGSLAVSYMLFSNPHVPRSVPIIHWMIASITIAIVRFSWRGWNTMLASVNDPDRERCLIYGAGVAGDQLVRHVSTNPRFPYSIVGFIDDDKNKVGRVVHGLKILGTSDNLDAVARRFDVKTVLLAIHSLPGKVMRDVVSKCQALGVKPLIVPEIASAIGEDVFRPRPVELKDLLCRAPKSLDREKITRFFTARSVLVTGAGGSIGSEICRQVIACQPERLILLDINEFNLYGIHTELLDAGFDAAKMVTVLGSATDRGLVDRTMKKHRPTVVLHAAAYKHVPMLEDNAAIGITNNVLGTLTVARAAVAHGVEQFLLISTDKAVRPTSVMGASKRCCEIAIQALQAQGSSCRFSAVRFGNVLGSSGSVIPRFIHQIQTGGPVTVTHPDMTRYFMLIPEAVGLVLQSSSMAKGGEVFVLNMGDPVRIHDMARQLIMLAGKQPGKDVDIVVTGLRPGEKLHEELILEKNVRHNKDDDIFVATPEDLDPVAALESIESILTVAQTGDHDASAVRVRALAGAPS